MEGFALRYIREDIMVGEMSISQLNGKEIYLPDGRRLGLVGETVIDGSTLRATHIFVAGCPDELVEQGVHMTVPWRWVRSIGDIVILRWFPKTPIPYEH